MRTPSIITSPYPTLEQTAKFYGVSAKRVAELQKLADEIMAGERARKTTRKKRAANPRVATRTASQKKKK